MLVSYYIPLFSFKQPSSYNNRLPFWREVAVPDLVSFAAVIRGVTRHATSDDPNNGCEGDYAWSRPWDKGEGTSRPDP